MRANGEWSRVRCTCAQVRAGGRCHRWAAPCNALWSWLAIPDSMSCAEHVNSHDNHARRMQKGTSEPEYHISREGITTAWQEGVSPSKHTWASGTRNTCGASLVSQMSRLAGLRSGCRTRDLPYGPSGVSNGMWSHPFSVSGVILTQRRHSVTCRRAVWPLWEAGSPTTSTRPWSRPGRRAPPARSPFPWLLLLTVVNKSARR